MLLERPALVVPDNVALLAALYDAEITVLDEAFGALLDRLRELGLDRSTLVVFVADHGEEFHEHGGLEHGRTLFQEVVRVPLVIRLPGGAEGGRRVAGLARQIDVLPTVLSLLGHASPPDLPGRSLLGGGRRADEALLETRLGRPALRGVVAGRWKGIWSDLEPGRPTGEVYDLAHDAAEQRNLAATHPIVLGWLRQTAARLAASRAHAPAADTTVVDPETEQRLRALGYVDAP